MRIRDLTKDGFNPNENFVVVYTDEQLEKLNEYGHEINGDIKQELVLTGTAIDRGKKREILETIQSLGLVGIPYQCFRCGTYVSPWNKSQSMLCPECSKDLEDERYNKQILGEFKSASTTSDFSWRSTPVRVLDTNDRIVLETNSRWFEV